MWVYFIQEKSLAFEKFKMWHKRVEIETGMKVKKVRIKEENSFQQDSMTITRSMAFSANSQLRTCLNKME